MKRRHKYSEQALMDKFDKLPMRKQIECLWDALGLMNQYNGRTEKECVCMAMGYEWNGESECWYKERGFKDLDDETQKLIDENYSDLL